MSGYTSTHHIEDQYVKPYRFLKDSFGYWRCVRSKLSVNTFVEKLRERFPEADIQLCKSNEPYFFRIKFNQSDEAAFIFLTNSGVEI